MPPVLVSMCDQKQVFAFFEFFQNSSEKNDVSFESPVNPISPGFWKNVVTLWARPYFWLDKPANCHTSIQTCST